MGDEAVELCVRIADEEATEGDLMMQTTLKGPHSLANLRPHESLSPEPDAKSSALRLLLISSRVKKGVRAALAALRHVKIIQYRHDGVEPDAIMAQVKKELRSLDVTSIGIYLPSRDGALNICCNSEKVYQIGPNCPSTTEYQKCYEFLKALVNYPPDDGWSPPDKVARAAARLDVFSFNSQNADGCLVLADHLSKILETQVLVSREMFGADVSVVEAGETVPSLGSLYFKPEKMRSDSIPQTMAGFEKIRTVGKGAYGAAVLYRKKDDDSLVILKEVNMHDLAAAERQLALNEVKVLSMMDHPNIIGYYDSFEEDGVLVIEMEYADGGTLAHYLADLEQELSEKQIVTFLQQMTSALHHIHSHNILHRDLKTDNIFLTKDGVIKLGDFGISKIMSSTRHAANTVLGTPYYLSPEMCEGKEYNEKSDIWALGCVLYELACLQRTFEGTNLPALVNKIMKGQFMPIRGNYSQEFRSLAMDMLQREPIYRPSAHDILYMRLPELMPADEETVDHDEELNSSGDSRHDGVKVKPRSLLFAFDVASVSLKNVEMNTGIRIRQVAVSSSHTLIVTTEGHVFSWGQGSKGQLGHGSLDSFERPKMIKALRGKSVIRACCSETFSIVASDNGIVMTFGDGSQGCLGHGDYNSTSRPKLIEALLSVDVVSIDCGSHHVVAVGRDGEVYSWGQGPSGELGLGPDDDRPSPSEVTISDPVLIRRVKCSRDGTMFLTDAGALLACGNNENNKLGLNNRKGFLMQMKNLLAKIEVDSRNIPTIVKSLAKHCVTDMYLGPNHSAVFAEQRHVYMFGLNGDGQLGTGTSKKKDSPVLLKEVTGANLHGLACGNDFTLVACADNSLWFCGTRYVPDPNTPASEIRPQSGPARVHRSPSVNSTREPSPKPTGETKAIVEKRCESEEGRVVPGEPSRLNNSLSVASPDELLSQTLSDIRTVPAISPTPDSNGKTTRNIVTPFEIFRLSSENVRLVTSSLESENSDKFPVTLQRLVGRGDRIMIVAEIMVPCPAHPRKRSSTDFKSASSLRVPSSKSTRSEDGDVDSSSSDESDVNDTTVPIWIQDELHSAATRNSGKASKTMSTIEGKEIVARQAITKMTTLDVPDIKHVGATPSSSSGEASTSSSSVEVTKTAPQTEQTKGNDEKNTITGSQSTSNQNQRSKSEASKDVKVKPTNPSVGQAYRQPQPRVKSSTRNKNQVSLERLEEQVKCLREEKESVEERLQKSKTEQEDKQREMLEEQKKVALEKEKVLMGEVDNLRLELKCQHLKMEENYNLVLNLQDQLLKFQSDQLRQSAREQRAHRGRPSKVCSLM